MTEQHWYQMAWEIAKTAPNDFDRIYALCNRQVSHIDMTLPARNAAATLRPPPTSGTIELTSNSEDGFTRRIRGLTPPPPPPRVQPYSVDTPAGPALFEPDSVTDCYVDTDEIMER